VLAERRISPLEAAAAARISKGTLYRILEGRTKQPHLKTVRRLAKVLGLDVAELLGAEQLQLALAGLEMESTGILSEMERLLVAELRSFPTAEIPFAAVLAALAILETTLGSRYGEFANTDNDVGTLRERVLALPIEELVRYELRKVPKELRPSAVRAALAALVDLRLLRGEPPTSAMYQSAFRVRYRLWRPLGQSKRARKQRSRL
jgi:transcriptional regulator with XRE-family HTH domain